MTILITGSNGLVGSHLVRYFCLNSQAEIFATSFSQNRLQALQGFEFHQVDIRQKEHVDALINKIKPNVIFHCAAISQVDLCEKDPELCYQVNVVGTRNLLTAAQKVNSKFIFYSTDFVFSGNKGSDYTEADSKDPISIYGESKAQAEDEIIETYEDFTIIRPILIYGTSPSVSRGNIIKWVKSSLAKNQSIAVVDDQYRQPTSIQSLVQLSASILEKDVQGIFHAAGAEQLSVYQFAKKTAEFYGLDGSLVSPISSQKLNETGKRPAKTWFDLKKSKEILNFIPHDVKEGLENFEKF